MGPVRLSKYCTMVLRNETSIVSKSQYGVVEGSANTEVCRAKERSSGEVWMNLSREGTEWRESHKTVIKLWH